MLGGGRHLDRGLARGRGRRLGPRAGGHDRRQPRRSARRSPELSSRTAARVLRTGPVAAHTQGGAHGGRAVRERDPDAGLEAARQPRRRDVPRGVPDRAALPDLLDRRRPSGDVSSRARAASRSPARSTAARRGLGHGSRRASRRGSTGVRSSSRTAAWVDGILFPRRWPTATARSPSFGGWREYWEALDRGEVA